MKRHALAEMAVKERQDLSINLHEAIPQELFRQMRVQCLIRGGIAHDATLDRGDAGQDNGPKGRRIFVFLQFMPQLGEELGNAAPFRRFHLQGLRHKVREERVVFDPILQIGATEQLRLVPEAGTPRTYSTCNHDADGISVDPQFPAEMAQDGHGQVVRTFFEDAIGNGVWTLNLPRHGLVRAGIGQ